ncbi:MAG: hypothetical protein JXB47_13065 [Anaerolineae bacterium]|nr:hypothetical protein [Anaerolineae bacterium]
MMSELAFQTMSEYAQLRDQAIELLDLCLTEGEGGPLLAFIDEQIANDPPRIGLLRMLADDLQLRLLSLREYRFDVRDRVVCLFRDDFSVDITDAAPPDGLDHYHLLDPQTLVACVEQQGQAVTEQERLLLLKTAEASIEIVAQLTADVRLAEYLRAYVTDWLQALNTQRSRTYQPNEPPGEYVQ